MNVGIFDQAPLATQLRLLRLLLPSAKGLPCLTWNLSFEPCFYEAQASSLTSLNVKIGRNDGPVLPWKVLEALSAPVKIRIWNADRPRLAGVVLQPIYTALRNGALQHLANVELSSCTFGNGDVRNFAGALEESGCAARLASLSFSWGELGIEGVLALADSLCRGAFPAMKKLRIDRDTTITDVGMVALAEALLMAPQTFLVKLQLGNVGMADEGMTALASVVSQGRFEQLEELDLSSNIGITNHGIIAFAHAIESRGLPLLRELILRGLNKDKMTREGITAIAQAVIKGCPILKHIDLMWSAPNDNYRDLIIGMLEAAGWGGEVYVY